MACMLENRADERYLDAGHLLVYPDAAIFREWALRFHRPHAEIVAVLLEEQPVARLHSQRTPHFDGHCDLTFTGALRLHLHRHSPIPYSTMPLLTFWLFPVFVNIDVSIPPV